MLVIIASYFYIIITSLLHPFHVSVCEVYHNNDTHSLEVSMKVFIDDLETSIRQSGNTDFTLVGQSADHVNEKYIENYLSERFKIKVNDKPADLSFLGFEFDEDAILCYFEGKKIKKIAQVEILNAIMTEVFDDQINLTHFQYHDEMKSLRTSKENTMNRIDTSTW